MFMMSQSGEKMAELLKQVLDKGTLCPDDYTRILQEAEKDGITDKHEERLLKALQELIENKMLVRVSSCDEYDMHKH